MKKITTFYFLLLFVTSIFAQKVAVVHNIKIEIDHELIFGTEIETSDRNYLTSYSERDTFPEAFVDTIMQYTSDMLSEELQMEVETKFTHNKKGKEQKWIGTARELEGLPCGTFKKALGEYQADYYINVTAQITGGGTSIRIANDKFTRVKPKIHLKVVVLDVNKEKFWNRKITLKEFGKLRGRAEYVQSYRGTNYEVTDRETLTSDDILWIYLTALKRMMEDDE